MKDTIKILSIDGGGIRGIIPATILDHIERITHKPIASLFDLIAGTSTGGILALGLTKPDAAGRPRYSAADLVNLYVSEGARIFSRSFWYRLLALDNLSEKKYPAAGIEAVLEQYFGDARLRDAITDVLVTSYEIEKSFPFFFRSSAARRYADYDFPMRDVARATSAAPTYFEPMKLNNYALIDGGVYANNPAACAYVEARTTFPDAANFMVVSLGTGNTNDGVSYPEAKNWGVAQWAKPILSVVFDGVSSTVDYQLRQIVPNYYRFQTTLPSAQASFDNASSANLTALQGLAHKFIEDQPDQMEQLCESLEK